MRLPLLLCAALLATTAPWATAATPADPCATWTVKELATGLGVLENLLPTRTEIYYSGDGVMRFTRGGEPTLVAAADSPGGLRMRDGSLWFVTGDGLQSGALGRADGTLQRLDLRTRRQTTVARGLTMPNGLLLLPDGSALTSRDVSGLHPTGITRITPRGAVQERWSDQDDSNGMALDPSGRYVYSDETFTYGSAVYRTEIAHPSRRTVVARLGRPGVPKGLDDLTLASSGALYLAANSAGEVLRLDPRTGASCAVASGLTTISSVRQGAGGDFPTGRLYATTFTGRLVELTPPPGVRP